MNYAAKWNKIDSFISFCESTLKEFKAAMSAGNVEEPDVELIIAAETEYLRKENEILKKRETPLYLIEEGTNVICPKCKAQIQQNADVKYCWNCGHRVLRNTKFENKNKMVETP